MKNLHFQRFIFFEGFLFITFSVFQFIIIDTVGLNYDEALFINAALPSNLFSQESNYIQTRIFGLPFSVFDYIGALNPDTSFNCSDTFYFKNNIIDVLKNGTTIIYLIF